MTTSWSHLVRGQILAALRASVSGSVLAVLCAAVAVYSLVTAVRGKWLAVPVGEVVWLVLVAALVFMILCEWVWRLAAA